MSADRIGYRGYVTARGFGGYVIPVPIQSLVLRDYCGRNGFLYVLPVNENNVPGSYMVLEGLIETLASYQGVVMCSMHMLPQRRERRLRIYERILEQGCTLHCVIEETVVAGAVDIDKIEDLVMLNQVVSRSPVAPAID